MDGLENEEDFFDDFEDFEEEQPEDGLEDGIGEEGIPAQEDGEGNSAANEGNAGDDFEQRIEEATKKRFDEFFKRQYGGYVNPITGQPVENEADLAAYQQALSETEYNRRMAEAGFDPNVLNNLIGNHPAILSAQRLQQEQQAREAENFSKTQMGNLLAKYPDCGITDLSQLEQSAAGRAVLQDWGKTGDLVKAYTANFAEEIMQRRTAAAKQGTLNNINGKRHLSQPKGNGGGGESMSQEEYKTWQGFFPEKSYEEIQKIWKENKEG